MTEVVAALIWKNNKFMICQRPAHKARGLLWEFVGGKVEKGETKEQALIRECREELNVLLSMRPTALAAVMSMRLSLKALHSYTLPLPKCEGANHV